MVEVVAVLPLLVAMEGELAGGGANLLAMAFAFAF